MACKASALKEMSGLASLIGGNGATEKNIIESKHKNQDESVNGLEEGKWGSCEDGLRSLVTNAGSEAEAQLKKELSDFLFAVGTQGPNLQVVFRTLWRDAERQRVVSFSSWPLDCVQQCRHDLTVR
ncbi:hypothetical protein NDU88_010838 [Pleurodeles waltl]|uniref:Uncharacterized protein n=1 Tax=Pleurodeles waltl TaxID=8319 RepID=A0AAV7RZC5_PLEWA|nr:hypothetical protein NDU88_010838 [Pleurodeles waltl]